RHCYASCGPHGETMSMENIERVIEHMPKNTFYFDISGGEPLMETERLMQMMGYIMKNKPRIMPDATHGMLTNGFWIKSANAYAILKELFDKGISLIEITSNDKFHREQGINGEELANHVSSLMGQLAAETGKIERGYGRHNRLESTEGHTLLEVNSREYYITAHPFGRGRELENNEIESDSFCKIAIRRQIEPAIGPDGLVYPCCWRVTPSIGSAIESPLEDLVENMAKSELFSALLKGGPKGAAQVLGVYREEDKEIYKRNPCVKCEEIFRELR
ncbi:MAG: hypothetical protein WC852_03045, partial [Candidatus Nanoarchaeia archaeon]